MSKNLPVVTKAHATLGASTASRWMNCPGSVRLIASLGGAGSNETEASREGTTAHGCAELAVQRQQDPTDFIGWKVDGGGEITEVMADHVRMFVNHCNDLTCRTEFWWTEKKFSLEKLNPPVPMFGTADFVAYEAESRTLHVVDLKYGAGVVVQVKKNKQLRYYALGAVLALGDEYPIDKIVITIVQPRCAHPDGPVRSEVVEIEELVEYTSELMDAARATQEPNAPLKIGDHCRFCPAMAICPAQHEHAFELAQVEFDVVESIPPKPETLPADVFAGMLEKLPILDAWSKAMWAHAEQQLKEGKEVPGFKLVERRPRRHWIDEKATTDWLEREGYKAEQVFEPAELKSPAQIEKVTGKKKFPTELVVKKSSGLTLVPEHDARPAASLTQGEEFDALPASTEND